MLAALRKSNPTYVRFGSKADMCGAERRVRFTPNSDRKSGHAALVMSGLHPKADMCGALSNEFHNYIGIIETRRRIWLN